MATSFSKIHVCGHAIKVRLLDIAEATFNGGLIYKPEEIKKGERLAAQEAIVLEVGPQAYQIFGDGSPWCKVGDHVLIKKYTCVMQDDCTDESDSKIGITLDENVIGVFGNE